MGLVTAVHNSLGLTAVYLQSNFCSEPLALTLLRPVHACPNPNAEAGFHASHAEEAPVKAHVVASILILRAAVCRSVISTKRIKTCRRGDSHRQLSCQPRRVGPVDADVLLRADQQHGDVAAPLLASARGLTMR